MQAKIAVIGAGYVGLPTAAVLAHLGHRVVCVEHDQERYEALVHGEVPIAEPRLGELVREGVGRGALRFAAYAGGAVDDADYVFLCVATPQGDDGAADVSAVEAVAGEISPCLRPGAVVVNKSTAPVGMAPRLEQVIGRADVAVVSNPEFLREGSAVGDSLRPARIVVGAHDRNAAASVGALFRGTGAPLVVTDTTTAEMIKYASNAFLATKISFVNSLAALCEVVGADVGDLVRGVGYDPRIGSGSLQPGPGWGGSCLPKDTSALLHIARSAGHDLSLVREAVAVNEAQLARVVGKIAPPGAVTGGRVGVWGLTFKAGTDDRRGSPAVEIVRRLVEGGARVAAYDPTLGPGAGARDLPKEGITLCEGPYEAARAASVLAILTEWDDLRRLDFEKVRELMASPRVVDARNLLDPVALRRLGFEYVGIGRS